MILTQLHLCTLTLTINIHAKQLDCYSLQPCSPVLCSDEVSVNANRKKLMCSRPPAADKLKLAYPANRLTTRLREARTRLMALQQDGASRNQAPKACEYMCSQHRTIEVKFFCFECNQLICEACTHTQHVDHKFEHVREAADYHREVFQSACQ